MDVMLTETLSFFCSGRTKSQEIGRKELDLAREDDPGPRGFQLTFGVGGRTGTIGAKGDNR
jgi:hypothetical protein